MHLLSEALQNKEQFEHTYKHQPQGGEEEISADTVPPLKSSH